MGQVCQVEAESIQLEDLARRAAPTVSAALVPSRAGAPRPSPGLRALLPWLSFPPSAGRELVVLSKPVEG